MSKATLSDLCCKKLTEAQKVVKTERLKAE